ncbi:Wzz/FepE/Etk N-terminal domain-containing protein [Paracoccus sp. MBLB3053]|uniref:Wzz/FepE/Etk N-terminal domain-containing protein n=1 Tax=Paracoccus aurantius TaxID=3073814 RepID=A0ABU2HMT3_9RHOB|nr:Wzz/FepE/Etk N-terminal domain-containing protein [Paracoccus sp. MBLB3053]MDS9466341.1 Wzz/FepE/Etk N-terminal domain-containing protein [Paracoccus sp. MBLB3053]
MPDLISMLWRRLPLMLTIVILGVLSCLYLVLSSPRVYQASAVIQVDMPAATQPGSDSSLPASRRVQLIEQRLMARTNILDVIDRLDLFADVPEMSESNRIAAVRSSTRIESISAPGVSQDSRLSLAAIVITSSAEEAALAAAIANDFADSVVNRDRENREARIEETRSFLTVEEARLGEQLAQLDQKIAEFSVANEDALPSSQDALQTEMTRLTETENVLDREIMALQRDQLELVVGGGASDLRPTPSIVQRIREAEIQLAQARRTLAPGHPEIKRLQDDLERLNLGGETVSDVVRRQTDLLSTQLRQLDGQKEKIEARRREIDLARSRAPEIAHELEELLRQQRRLQDRYSEVSRQLAQIETQQLLIDNDQAERFVLLERALPPDYPAVSNRKKTAMLGTFASVALAFSMAFLLELMNPVLRRTEQFARVTGTRPVISLTYRPSRRDLRIRRLRIAYMVLLLIAGAVAALWLLGLLPGLSTPGVAAPPTDGMG